MAAIEELTHGPIPSLSLLCCLWGSPSTLLIIFGIFEGLIASPIFTSLFYSFLLLLFNNLLILKEFDYLE